MLNKPKNWVHLIGIVLSITALGITAGRQVATAQGDKTISESDCSVTRVETAIPVSAIGEPVSAVTLNPPRWIAATGNAPAYCSVDGSMAPVDRSPTAKPILFRVALPAAWTRRAAQLGGGGTNGVIPNLTGEPLQRGFATYGSDSGHQNPPAARGAAPDPAASDWWSNDEAVRNFGYMQMKKTHDAAMVIIERMYGERPRFNYYIGNSQGGREALTVAQRYPADYDGIGATVPVVALSSLQVAPVLIRIQEKAVANWVTPAKVNAIRGEFMRQCDKLDGLADGIINNYMGCRSIFDVRKGAPNRQPWAAKRCPDNVDPNPADTSANACLTDGQISTLQFVYSRYPFSTPLANGVQTFGMWLPNTDPSGSSLMAAARVRGQEGAAAGAPLYSYIGAPGITAGLMRDLNANPLDYTENDATLRRRRELSEILDSTNPDSNCLPASRRQDDGHHRHERYVGFPRRTTGLLPVRDRQDGPGRRRSVRAVLRRSPDRPWLDRCELHCYGDGKTIPSRQIPNTIDRLSVLMDWVERKVAPGKSLIVTAGENSLPLCSYPTYPKYVSGPASSSSSYACSAD